MEIALTSNGRSIADDELSAAMLSGVGQDLVTTGGVTITPEQLAQRMAAQDLAREGASWQGTWSSEFVYTQGDVVIDTGVVYEAQDDVAADDAPPSVNNTWEVVFDPLDGATPSFQTDSGDAIIRVVTTDARADASVTPSAPCFLSVVDLGSWQQPQSAQSFFSYYWQVGDAAAIDDESWVDCDNDVDAFDGPLINATQAAKYYRCRIRLTNANGFDETTSNAIGPLG